MTMKIFFVAAVGLDLDRKADGTLVVGVRNGAGHTLELGFVIVDAIDAFDRQIHEVAGIVAALDEIKDVGKVDRRIEIAREVRAGLRRVGDGGRIGGRLGTRARDCAPETSPASRR